MGGIAAEQVRTKIRQAFADLQHDLVAWQAAPAKTRRGVPSVEREILVCGSVSDVHAEFARRGWAAGLPFIPPTRDLVDALLEGTCHAPDEVVWDGVPPRMG